MTSVMYFWDAGTILTTEVGDLDDDAYCYPFIGLYCFDDIPFLNPGLRYGMYVVESVNAVFIGNDKVLTTKERLVIKWKSIPLEEFPKEFRAALLLIGAL